MFISCVSCEPTNDAEDADPSTVIPVFYKSLFTDKSYANGFYVSSTNEANSSMQGKLDYGGTVTATPVWRIGQWNCINNDMLLANYLFLNNQHEYRTGVTGNRIAVNTINGTLTLELNASTEYGLNGITSNPRKQNEPWPALLCDCSLPETRILKISDKSEIRMALEYKVLKIEDKMPVGTTDVNLHTAHFQWFITVQNRNKSSEEYGRYIWFGLNFHDKRYDYAPFYAAQDGGKENNTGAFIYMPEMQPLMVAHGKSEIGRKFNVDINILPIIRKAFTLAQQRNFLTKTKWEELYIGGTNIGWEVSGTYDVSVEVYKFDIKYL